MTLPITLTTDFGWRDPYVAVMKGVLRRRAPASTVIDLTHDIGPQDVDEGALFLSAALAWYPAAVHVAVIDPGVGTKRRPVAIATDESVLVGPDNGLFALHLERLGLGERSGSVLVVPDGTAMILDRPEFWLPAVSPTFHGRDIFAPVAAAVATGTPLSALGSPVRELVGLSWSSPTIEGREIIGQVIHVDRFGNLITNILPGERSMRSVEINRRMVPRLVRTYGEGSGLVALVGSSGYLEIAVVNGNAAIETGLRRGAPVIVSFE